MRFADGGTAEICTSVLLQSPPRVEIYGNAGYVRCEGTLGPHGGGSIDSHAGPIDFVPVDPYVGEIEDFVAASRDAREPEVGGAEALRNVELLVEASG